MSEQTSFPKDVAAKLSGGALYQDGRTALPFITVGSDGWPHVAMASGAVLQKDGRVAFPVHKASRSWGNIADRKAVTLIIVAPSIVAYIKGQGTLSAGPNADYDVCSLSDCRVQHDAPASSVIESGITYKLVFDDPSESRERQTFDALIE